MSARAVPGFICAFASNDRHEFGSHNSVDSLNATTFNVEDPPSWWPSGIAMPKVLNYNDTVSADSDRRVVQNMTGVGFYIAVEDDGTTPGAGKVHLGPSIDAGAAGGVGLGLSSDDKWSLGSQNNGDLLAEGNTARAASDEDVYWVWATWDNVAKWTRWAIHGPDGSGGISETPDEVLYYEGAEVGNMDNTIRIGKIGNPGTAGYFISGIYAVTTASHSPPFAPNFAAHLPNAGPGSDNSTKWVPGDGSGDDSTNEYTYINALNDDSTAGYLEDTDTSFSFEKQYYGHASGLVPSGQNVLCVATICRFYQESGGGVSQQPRIELSGSEITGGATYVKDSAGARDDAAWGYQLQAISRTKPGGGDWTITDVDNAQMGHQGLNTSGDIRISEEIMYAVYGDDIGWVWEGFTSGYEITSAAAAFTPRVVMF